MKTKLLVLSLISICFMLSFTSCSDDDDSGIKVYEYREQIGKKIKEVTDLQSKSEFGLREGMYPEESKTILETALSGLKTLLQDIKDLKVTEAQVPDATAKVLGEADQKMKDFKATIRTEDLIVPAELFVYGKNGSYIDFGSHPEFSSFGESGKQAFTIDFWVKLQEVEGYMYLLSTFTDDDVNDHEREGWSVNSYNFDANRMRMTYGMGFNDLMEPGFDFTTIDEWVHITVVTNESGVDGESHDGKPIMTKMYLNGELKLSEVSNQTGEKYYSPNKRNLPMVAFNGMHVNGHPLGNVGCNGSMKYMHIWNTPKNQEEITEIMNNPDGITGQEADLVCGWNLDRISFDNQNIEDITGKYSAKLVGECEWIEIK